MAVGLNFLTATSKGKNVQDIMKNGGANKSNNVSNVFAKQDNKSSQKAENTDLANMNTSDLINHVYNNEKQDNNDIKLPIAVKYNDMDFAANGKKFDDVVKEITQKTGDSKAKVESELKRNYGSATGGSLNMQA